MSDLFETFSHTHRGFDLSRNLDAELVYELKTQAQQYQDYVHCAFIQDPQLIEWIYGQSQIPLVDSHKIPELYSARKNSQLLAPLLVAMTIKEGRSDVSRCHYLAGRAQSRMALTALAQGLQNGFCICFENGTVETRLKKLGIMPQDHIFGSLPLMSLGYQQQGRRWDWCSDTQRHLGGPKKIDSQHYLKII